jgi:hypothetical protein
MITVFKVEPTRISAQWGEVLGLDSSGGIFDARRSWLLSPSAAHASHTKVLSILGQS